MAASMEEVLETEEAMRDRFGPLPGPASALVRYAEIRCLAEQNGIALVQTEGDRLKCRLAISSEETYVKVGKRFPRLTGKNGVLRLNEIISFLKRRRITSK